MAHPTRDLIRRISQKSLLFYLSTRASNFRITDETIVVFAAHPDDETLGCGGLIASKRRCGATVKVVFVTDGTGARRPVVSNSDDEFREIRHQEASAALSKLSVNAKDVVFLDLPETELQEFRVADHTRALNIAADIISASNASQVVTLFRCDAHPHHRFTYEFACSAIEQTGTDIPLFEYMIASLWTPWSLRPRMFKNVFVKGVDIRAVHPRKLEALQCYTSQFQPQNNEPSFLPLAYAELFSGYTEFFLQFSERGD